MPFNFTRSQIPDVVVVEPRTFLDARGFFRETYKSSEFAANGLPSVFVQDNYSHSTHGVVRGLHYQKLPRAQGKLVAVSRGEILDVAVDIRKGSPTFGQWIGQVLSAENGCMLYIPPGFAHGFAVLSDEADVVYKVTTEYARELDRGILWNDPDIGVQWHVTAPVLSAKDEQLPRLRDADNNFVYDIGSS